MPVAHRWFAASYDLLTRSSQARLAPLRRFVAGGATGRVLEIGFGTGGNLPFYEWDNVECVAATEPDPFMLKRAARKIGDAPAGKITLIQAAAESLPFPDAAFDAVVTSLVLCTVEDPVQSLAEVRRVLRPDGSFRLIEHVRGDGWLGRAQDAVQPVYGWFAGGCHANRRTEQAIRDAGFELERLQHLKIDPWLPAIVGVARAPG
jgi:ubiquinone/menaquinone biosynthesis C-methylase UbiE